MKISIIVPAYNEEDNVYPLLEKFHEEVKKTSRDWEVVFVDDGSTDSTYDRITEVRDIFPFLKILRHSRNQGKTEALLTGFESSSGEILVLFDADLQYQPSDVHKLVDKIGEGFDLVCGFRQGRYQKAFVTRIYRLLSRWLFGIPVRDQNSVKAIHRKVIEEIPLKKDWHRYLVTLAHDRGFKIGEVPVELHPRLHGKGKYSGPGRVIIGLLDLISVKFQLSFMKKPMLLFGSLGIVSLFLGFLTGLVALYMRIIQGIGFRPLLYLVILLISSGLLLFALGFLAEILSGISERMTRIEKKISSRKE
jgi:glycosyltransferase involved in cell wall biosynthesis